MIWKIASRHTMVTPALIALPDHLIIQISSFLDRTSAISLACTCSALRPLAETSVWQDLNISIHRPFAPHPEPYEITKPLGGDWLYNIRQRIIWGDDHPGVPCSSTAGDVSDYFSALLQLLQHKPGWKSSVRRAYIDIDRLLCDETHKFLLALAPTMHTLLLITNGNNPHPRLPLIHFTPLQLFTGLGTNCLDRLTFLQIPIGQDWEETLLAVIRTAPRIQTLHIVPEHAHAGGWGTRHRFHSCETINWPALRYLRSILVDEMETALSPMLLALLRGSQDIAKVSIGDSGFNWMPDHDLLQALSSRPKLKYLACGPLFLPFLARENFPHLDQLSFTTDKRAWGVSHIEVGIAVA